MLFIGALLQFIAVLSCKISPHEYDIFMQYAFNNSTIGVVENKFFNVVDSLIFAPVFEETIFRFILMNFFEITF